MIAAAIPIITALCQIVGKKAWSIWPCKPFVLLFPGFPLCFVQRSLKTETIPVDHLLCWLQLFGYFGGVHLAVLSAFVCQRHPNASLSALMSIFFKTLAFWPWPTPVCLDGRLLPPMFPTDVRFLMPIQLPCSPNQYCQCNITRSTFYRIRGEFVRGYAIIEVTSSLQLLLIITLYYIKECKAKMTIFVRLSFAGYSEA